MDAAVKFSAEYSKYLASFKTLSFDKENNQSLCHNTTHQYYNFDEIVKSRNYDFTPASPDTIIFNDNKIYCIEFKNSFRHRVSAKVVKEKVKKGHQVLLEIFQELDLQREDYQLIFCVVHKGFDKSKVNNQRWEEVHDRIKEKHSIQFELEQYKGQYYDDILTNDVDFFRNQFIEKINPNLSC